MLTFNPASSGLAEKALCERTHCARELRQEVNHFKLEASEWKFKYEEMYNQYCDALQDRTMLRMISRSDWTLQIVAVHTPLFLLFKAGSQ